MDFKGGFTVIILTTIFDIKKKNNVTEMLEATMLELVEGLVLWWVRTES